MEEITTLRDVAKLILRLNPERQRKPVWIGTANILAKAAQTGLQADIEQTRIQLVGALLHEGWF